MVISLVSFGLFGPALSTTNINILKWRYFVIFSPVFFCSLNWEFSYSNWEKNILFGIGNTTKYRSSKRAKKTPAPTLSLKKNSRKSTNKKNLALPQDIYITLIVCREKDNLSVVQIPPCQIMRRVEVDPSTNILETVLAAQLFLEKNQSTESIDGNNIHEGKS